MKRLLPFLLAPMLAFAGWRVDSEDISSTAVANGTNCVMRFQIPNPHGAELKELSLFQLSTNAPTLTAAVTRVSYDLINTSAVATVVSAGTNTFTSLYAVETARMFRLNDFLVVSATQTNVSFKTRPVFLSYDD